MAESVQNSPLESIDVLLTHQGLRNPFHLVPEFIALIQNNIDTFNEMRAKAQLAQVKFRWASAGECGKDTDCGWIFEEVSGV